MSVVNLFVGAIYGSIEGYYGGKVDLIMERIVDILGSIPSMIVITLLKYHLNVSHIVILFISFFATGWVGMASRTRMQFYRFKNQEYVLVARTLGARDRRIMFKKNCPVRTMRFERDSRITYSHKIAITYEVLIS